MTVDPPAERASDDSDGVVEAEAVDPDRAAEQLEALRDNVEAVFRGKSAVVRRTLACIVARGHLLLEDVPGVGKTTLARAVARSLDLSFQRIQFTSDLLPGDILGVSVYSEKTEEFEFRPGPIFSNVVLGDEINRTTPRTQSALLEAMSEGSVSTDNVTRELPEPFLVIATQNPLEHQGTYPLPESQLDRFLMRLSVGYPEREVERRILRERGLEEPVRALEPVLDADAFRNLQRTAAEVRAGEDVREYILDIVEATRRDDRIRIAVSTRGALALVRAARALALLQGRDFIVPEDIHELAVPCLAHRLRLADAGPQTDHEQSAVVVRELVAEIEPPT